MRQWGLNLWVPMVCGQWLGFVLNAMGSYQRIQSKRKTNLVYFSAGLH